MGIHQSHYIKEKITFQPLLIPLSPGMVWAEEFGVVPLQIQNLTILSILTTSESSKRLSILQKELSLDQEEGREEGLNVLNSQRGT